MIPDNFKDSTQEPDVAANLSPLGCPQSVAQFAQEVVQASWSRDAYPRWGRSGNFPVLHIPAAFHRLQHSDFVGVFDVAAHWNAHRDARNFHADAFELLREISRGSFAFDRWVGGDDDFVDIARINARDEIANAQLIRTDTVQRRDGTVQDVEDSVEVLGLFDGRNVGRLFNYAHQALITSRAGAVNARI